MTEITHDEWRAALADAEGPSDPNALSVGECVTQFGMERSAARRLMDKLVATGKATKTHKIVADVSGRRQRVPAYRLVKAQSKKKR
jgi:hypothetical protein